LTHATSYLPADGFFSALQKRRGKRIGIPGEQTDVGAHGNETIAPFYIAPRIRFNRGQDSWHFAGSGHTALHINYPKYIIDTKIYYNALF
jgi:hypothetical protein